jgi:uncharacterized Tic20 family protein
MQSEEERGRTMAVLGHLIGIVALVFYLMEKDKPDRNRFICHHACEAINHLITFMGVWLVGMVAFMGSGIVTVSTGSGDGAAVPIIVLSVWGAMMLTMVANLGLAIVAAVKASQGVWWRYPLSIRLVGRGIDWQNA